MSQALHVAVGDASLAVRIDGDSDKPWLMLSNSLAADMTMWEPQIAELATYRRVVRYDTRGHGRSDAPKGPYDFDRLVGDVVAIMDRLGVASSDILGLSLGGMTALGIGLSHPERVRRLICCSARGEFPPAAIVGWDQRIAAVTAGGLAAIVDETLARWFTPHTHRERPDIVEHGRRMVLSTSVEGYLGAAAALKTLSYRKRLFGLSVSTLFLAGEEDAGAPPSVMREMADVTPNATFVAVPETAHIVNLEAVDAFNQAVQAFLIGESRGDRTMARA